MLDWINRFRQTVVNKVNLLYFNWVGGGDIPLDFTNTWAIETAFMKNPDVYAVLMQMASKTSSVPYYIREINKEEEYKNYQIKRQNYIPSAQGLLYERKNQSQTFNDNYKPIPLEKPNPLMRWGEFMQLSKIYLRATGNVFWYILKNEQGKPIAIYVLPSHLMQIKLKPQAFALTLESPILGYELVYSQNSVPFLEDEVIHLKMPNPQWTFSAEQLYGRSPLAAAYVNIENQLQANNHLFKMFKSSGAFGFIFAKGEALTPEQAEQFHDRIKEMDQSKDRMSKISALGKEVGFQRVSLANDELQPWEALQWDRKTICNVLGWQDELLNNDGKASLGSSESKTARKVVITDNILPDLLMIEEALNENFITLFKGYEKYRIHFDVSELPEMQEDVKELNDWAKEAPITLQEWRELLKYPRLEVEGMDDVWINRGKIRLQEAMIDNNFLANIPDDEGTTI
jgi:HK97 family phage portal protein